MLEVVRHVNIGHDLVRPTTECLTGNRLITSYFKSNPDQEPLGRRALKLMQSQVGDGQSYSAVGSEWVSSSLPPGRREGDAGDLDAPPDVEAQLGSLRQRVKALVRLQEALLLRLARLELRALELREDSPELQAQQAEQPREPAANMASAAAQQQPAAVAAAEAAPRSVPAPAAAR